MPQKITKATAEKLWADLRDALLNTEELINRIVETEAWKPLGYNTFIDAWADRMADLTLTGTQQATVVYAMLNDGAKTAEIADAIKGVGPNTARKYEQAHSAGMDTEAAATHVSDRAGSKRPSTPPAPRNTIKMEGFASDDLKAWQAAARDEDTPFPEWCKSVFTIAANQATGR